MPELEKIIEALIFASDLPLPSKKIKDILEKYTEKEIKKGIAAIKQKYEKNGSPLDIIEAAGGFQIVTREEYAKWIKQLYRGRSANRLTQRALETLAIIAYKQPLTKQEVEGIRGVNSDAVIKTLMERNLITISGRVKAPGNPLLYSTTKKFLEYFGIVSLKDLPKLQEIDDLLKSDENFLESLDQVVLEQLNPEELGLTSMEADDSRPADEEGNQENPEEEQKDDETQ